MKRKLIVIAQIRRSRNKLVNIWKCAHMYVV